MEAIATGFSLDIAPIEARHSSNREMTLMKNKGWMTTLQCLSAKFISKTVGELTRRVDTSQRTKKEQKNTNKDNKKPAVGKKKSSKGGGGAWRAYCHKHGKGKKFDIQTLQALATGYRSLSVEEKQVYVEAGKAAVRARKAGFQSFVSEQSRSDKKRASKQSQRLCDGDETCEVLAEFQYSGQDVFLDTYNSLISSLNAERAVATPNLVDAARSFRPSDSRLSKSFSLQEQEDLAVFESDTGSVSVVDSMAKLGHCAMGSSFIKTGSRISRLVSLEWFPPVANVCKVRF